MRLAVTTALRPKPDELAAARAAAARHGLPFAPRADEAMPRLLAAAGVDALLILTRRHAGLFMGVEEHRFAPGMGFLRMKRVLAQRAGQAPRTGEQDPLLEAAEVREGDVVVDATLGLAADALTVAAAVGPSGRVIGLESSPPLAAWADEGLRRLGVEPATRIEVRAGDHLALLAAMPAASADLVLFDPMFRHPREEPGGFDVIRRLADPRRLDELALAEAARVARRWVVVKDGAPGWDLARLGLTPLPSARGAHRYYGRLPGRG